MYITDEMVQRFLTWPLPDSVCSDINATLPGAAHRSGTNLLTAIEARAMLEHVLQPSVFSEPHDVPSEPSVFSEPHDVPSEPGEAVAHPTYGTMDALIDDIEATMSQGDWPRIGQMGALRWFARNLCLAPQRPRLEAAERKGGPYTAMERIAELERRVVALERRVPRGDLSPGITPPRDPV